VTLKIIEQYVILKFILYAFCELNDSKLRFFLIPFVKRIWNARHKMILSVT